MCEAFLLSFKTVLRFHHLPPPSDRILYFQTIFSIITQSCDIIARGGVVQFSHECDHRFYGQRQHSTTWKTSTGIKVAKNNDYSQTKCFSCGQCANKGIETNGKKGWTCAPGSVESWEWSFVAKVAGNCERQYFLYKSHDWNEWGGNVWRGKGVSTLPVTVSSLTSKVLKRFKRGFLGMIEFWKYTLR